jgi:hypothetical protein
MLGDVWGVGRGKAVPAGFCMAMPSRFWQELLADSGSEAECEDGESGGASMEGTSEGEIASDRETGSEEGSDVETGSEEGSGRGDRQQGREQRGQAARTAGREEGRGRS